MNVEFLLFNYLSIAKCKMRYQILNTKIWPTLHPIVLVLLGFSWLKTVYIAGTMGDRAVTWDLEIFESYPHPAGWFSAEFAYWTWETQKTTERCFICQSMWWLWLWIYISVFAYLLWANIDHSNSYNSSRGIHLFRRYYNYLLVIATKGTPFYV